MVRQILSFYHGHHSHQSDIIATLGIYLLVLFLSTEKKCARLFPKKE